MKHFKVILTRSYAVDISADNIQSARDVAEFFIGNPKDVSNKEEQKYPVEKCKNSNLKYNLL